jgi:carbon monoxide dehydrogenase subunit G
MEVKLDKRYPVDASPEQAWAVLRDIRATAACMPGAQITEQVDDTHYKGIVKSKIGPAVMNFAGDIEMQGLDADHRELRMLGKGADRGGSSASMQLTARLEPAEDGGAGCMLVGQATVLVSGKLAQFGSRLLVPVSDAMLAQFADNFRAAAAAVELPSPAQAASQTAPADAVAAPGDALATTVAPTPARAGVGAAPVKELNALSLAWTVFKNWLAGLFGKRA